MNYSEKMLRNYDVHKTVTGRRARRLVKSVGTRFFGDDRVYA